MKVYTSDGRLKVSLLGYSYQAVAADITLTALVSYLFVSAACTITLPAVATVPAFTPMTIKTIVAGDPPVIVAGDGSETIDDELTKTIAFSYSAMTIISDGVQWRIV